MPLTLEQLTAEAMQLPVESRALLADKLVESLDFVELDEIQRLWAAEAIRRRDEIRSSRVKSLPGRASNG
ncbi:MAG TPA: addiction module protein [Pyrinomonadaceae bacterium]|nr:addiction module protein [Pyrinomonadaceae bacterium]